MIQGLIQFKISVVSKFMKQSL